ncbi:hypothetical protein V6N11_018337 [Hibiscus sabdariffa]|uniref:Uncharacterized protein n=1 Tax=Hibiscus sabdariffa TaxID=183260 RepID=A0ABR2T7Q5_9ROSI
MVLLDRVSEGQLNERLTNAAGLDEPITRTRSYCEPDGRGDGIWDDRENSKDNERSARQAGGRSSGQDRGKDRIVPYRDNRNSQRILLALGIPLPCAFIVTGTEQQGKTRPICPGLSGSFEIVRPAPTLEYMLQQESRTQGSSILFHGAKVQNMKETAVDQAIVAKIGEYNQLSLRISSLDQKQARGGIPQRESVPTIKAICVMGACFLKPPIKTIFWHARPELLGQGLRRGTISSKDAMTSDLRPIQRYRNE